MEAPSMFCTYTKFDWKWGSGEIAGKMQCDRVLFSAQHTGNREAQGYSATVESGKTQANPVSSYLLEFSF